MLHWMEAILKSVRVERTLNSVLVCGNMERHNFSDNTGKQLWPYPGGAQLQSARPTGDAE